MPLASPDSFVPLFGSEELRSTGRPVHLRVLESPDPVRPLSLWLRLTGNGAAATGTPAPPHFFGAASPTQPGSEPDAPARRALEPQGRTPPLLTVVRDGTRVVGIELRCECGQVWNLLCEYQDSESAPTGQSTPQPTQPAQPPPPCPAV